MHTENVAFCNSVVQIFKCLYMLIHRHKHLHTIQSLNKFSKIDEGSVPVIKKKYSNITTTIQMHQSKQSIVSKVLLNL